MSNEGSVALPLRSLWIGTGAAALAVGVLYRLAGLSITGGGWLLTFVCAILFLSGRSSALRGSGLSTLVELMQLWCLFSVLSALGGLASYAVAAMTTGYSDDMLAAADRNLGFDWLELYTLSTAYPRMSAAARIAYCAIFVIPPLLLTCLVCTGQTARARAFVLAYGVALALTNLIFPLAPARSALLQFVGSAPSYMPATGVHHAAIIDALRSGAMTQVDPGELAGLIAFPSFHMAAGLLFIWAAAPMRTFGPPIIAMSLAMIAATPIEGTHYMIDLVGGALVGLAALAAQDRLGRRAGAPQPSMLAAA